MAVIRPYQSGDKWFHIKTLRKHPDTAAGQFCNSGEFSPKADLAFDRHIERLNRATKFFRDEIRERIRIKRVTETERPWY